MSTVVAKYWPIAPSLVIGVAGTSILGLSLLGLDTFRVRLLWARWVWVLVAVLVVSASVAVLNQRTRPIAVLTVASTGAAILFVVLTYWFIMPY